MKFVLDTNVLIAAFVSHGTCHDLLEYVARRHMLVLSDYILDEVERKLREKFGASRAEARDARSLLRDEAEIVTPVEIQLSVDPDDLPVLGTALAARADALVTGDKELVALSAVGTIPILSPREFWRWERDRQPG